MAEIKLPNNFYIDCKPGCYWLRERYIGKTKNGEPRESTRPHGYYRDLQSALYKYLEINTLNGLQAVEIWEVGKLVEQSNKMAVYKIEQILKGVQDEINRCGRIT